MSKYLTLYIFLSITIVIGCGDPKVQGQTSVQAEINAETGSNEQKGDESKLDQLSLDLYNSADNLYAWRKTRGSLDPNEDVIFYWQGFVYPYQDKDPRRFAPQAYNVELEAPLFSFEGFNVARFAEDGAGGYYMLSREVSVYRDPNTGKIIDCWENKLLPNRPKVRVLHVANDPVNFSAGPVNFSQFGNRVSFYSDVLISYRSPLAGESALSPFSASDVYQSNELFNFYTARKDLENPNLRSVPVDISWTRVGQYLPWMQMGDRPGKLIYHVRGYKVLEGLEGLPSDLINWTIDVAGPKFLTSPTEVPRGYQPNATTWRVFKENALSGNYNPSCQAY